MFIRGKMVPSFHLGIALLAGTLLAFELLLLRLFRLAQGGEFTQVAISIALLGFGASGTLLTLARASAKRHARVIAVASGPLAGLAMLGAFSLGQTISFRPEFLVWGGRYMWQLILWTLPLCVPFLLGAAGLGVVFLRYPRHTRSLYGANLLGSGVGAAALWGALELIRPEQMIGVLAALAALAGALMAFRWRGLAAAACAAVFIAGMILVGNVSLPDVHLSDTRDLWRLRHLPDARTVGMWDFPDGRVDLIASDAFHWTPGASLLAPSIPWRQIAVVLDGDRVGDLIDPASLPSPRAPSDKPSHEQDQALQAAPWVGAAQMSQPETALFLDARSEIEIERTDADEFLTLALAPGALQRAVSEWRAGTRRSVRPRVQWIVANARQALHGEAPGADQVIQIDQGRFALDEDLLHTRAGFREGLDFASDAVVLAVPVDQPPRASLRLVALAARGLVERFGPYARRHLAALRSFSQVAVIASARPFEDEELLRLRRFCDRWGFDLIWAPDVKPGEVNQFNLLDRPIFYGTARRIFAGEAGAVFRESSFELRPPTDWWPFFWQPFNSATLWALLIGLRPQGLETIPEANAVMAVIHSLRALAVAAFTLILLPLAWMRRGASSSGMSRLRVFGHFAGLGLGYLTLEVLMIFLARRLLGDAVLAASVVIAGFLVFSGIGSLSGLRAPWIIVAILALTCVTVAALEGMARIGLGWPLPVRLAVILSALAPLAFSMGFPFPRGLQRLSDRAPALVPWAWGINGFASVIAAPLALLIALSGGYGAVLALGLLSYAVALATQGFAIRRVNQSAPAR